MNYLSSRPYKYTGYYNYYYPNGKIMAKLYYINGVKSGYNIWYYTNTSGIGNDKTKKYIIR